MLQQNDIVMEPNKELQLYVFPTEIFSLLQYVIFIDLSD